MLFSSFKKTTVSAAVALIAAGALALPASAANAAPQPTKRSPNGQVASMCMQNAYDSSVPNGYTPGTPILAQIANEPIFQVPAGECRYDPANLQRQGSITINWYQPTGQNFNGQTVGQLIKTTSCDVPPNVRETNTWNCFFTPLNR